jgi:HlyD family secretion protein
MPLNVVETPARSPTLSSDGRRAETLSTRAESAAPPAPPTVARGHTRQFILLAVVLFVAGLTVWRFESVPDTEPAELTLQGNIDVRQVNLSFKVEGRIDALAVDEGDAVKAGQVVATLDKRYFDDDLRAARARRSNAAATLARLEHGSRPEEIAQARAQTAEREATLNRANEDYQRARRLLSTGAMAREEFDLRRSAFEEAEARLKTARESQRLVDIGPRQEDIDAARAQLATEEAAVIQSERRLADSRLIAPNDGIILTRAREKGAILQAGETVFALTLISPVWVRTYANEPDLGFIQPGMTAAITTDSFPDRQYQGHVGFVSPTAEFTPKTVETRELRTSLVYRLRIIVDDPDGGLRQGMPVTVRLALPGPRPKPFWKRVQEAFYLDRLGLTGK